MTSSVKYVYVVLRADAYDESGSLVEHVTVMKAFQSEKTARSEVDRLNRINSEKGCRYYIETVRLDETRA
jgi:hypothetical protein